MPQDPSVAYNHYAPLRLTTPGGAPLTEACAHEPEPILLPPSRPIAKADSSY